MVFQYRPEWTGFSGAPGVSVFNARLSGAALSTGPQQLADDIATYYIGMSGQLPDDVTIRFPSEVIEMDTTTGVMTAIHAINPPASVSGTQAGPYAAPCGARVDWNTDAVVAGKRLRGRTYWVPITSAAYEADGTITTAFRDLLVLGGNNLVASLENIGSLAVWSRTHGILADVTSVSAPDRVAVLRSRRD